MSNIFLEGSDLDNDKYSINMCFDKIKGRKVAVIDKTYSYRRDFKIGDVVTIDCEKSFGYVYKVDTDDVKVDWGYVSEWENKIDLIIIPTEYARECLGVTVSNQQIGLSYDEYLNGWFKCINGHLDWYDGDDSPLLIGDNKFYKVKSIKYSEEKQTLIDCTLNRKLSLYKDFSEYTLYKTKLFRGDDFDTYQNAFYILDKSSKLVYFGGIKDDVRKNLAILYNMKKGRD